MWEDERNVNGGVWYIVIEKQSKYTKLNHYWLDLLMAIMGEEFERFNDLINGVVINMRARGAKICIWISDAVKGNCIELRELIDAKLMLTTTDYLYFRKHTFR